MPFECLLNVSQKLNIFGRNSEQFQKTLFFRPWTRMSTGATWFSERISNGFQMASAWLSEEFSEYFFSKWSSKCNLKQVLSHSEHLQTSFWRLFRKSFQKLFQMVFRMLFEQIPCNFKLYAERLSEGFFEIFLWRLSNTRGRHSEEIQLLSEQSSEDSFELIPRTFVSRSWKESVEKNRSSVWM